MVKLKKLEDISAFQKGSTANLRMSMQSCETIKLTSANKCGASQVLREHTDNNAM